MNLYPSAANYHVLAIIESCCRLGMNRRLLFDAIELDERDLQSPYLRQPREKILRLWKCAEQLSGDTLIGLKVGLMSETMLRSAAANLIDASPTLGDALNIGIRFQHLSQSIIKLHRYFDKNKAYIVAGDFGLSSEDAQSSIDLQMALIIARARNLSKGFEHRLKGLELHLKSGPKVSRGKYERLLDIPVKFHCESNQLVVPASILKLKNFSGNGEIYESMLTIVKGIELDISKSSDVCIQVRQIIGDRLGLAEIEIEDVAGLLGIGVRTLQRRLKGEGSCFTEIFDDYRRQQALNMIAATEPNIREISFRLGFSHISGFYDAFNRWTGLSPLQYRHYIQCKDVETST